MCLLSLPTDKDYGGAARQSCFFVVQTPNSSLLEPGLTPPQGGAACPAAILNATQSISSFQLVYGLDSSPLQQYAVKMQ